MPLQEGLDLAAQFKVFAASQIQIGGTCASGQLEGFSKDRHVTIGGIAHEIMRGIPGMLLQIRPKQVACKSLIFIKSLSSDPPT